MFKELIHRISGIYLSEQKKKLVVARLSRRLRALDLDTFTDYYHYLTETPEGAIEVDNLINRITTNKTDFFREMHHFDFLKEEVLPAIIANGEKTGNRRIRIWSAGCSTGEEPYSIAIVVSEAFKNRHGWDVKILATDLDTEVLQRASHGQYATQTLIPVPSEYLSKYFVHATNGYTVCDALKYMVAFRKLNFMSPSFPMKNPFDIIFCRNVIIYFDQSTKTALMNKFHAHLKPQGFIFIGHSESLMSMKDKFKYIKHTVYQKA